MSPNPDLVRQLLGNFGEDRPAVSPGFAQRPQQTGEQTARTQDILNRANPVERVRKVRGLVLIALETFSTA